jgi:hypothetical protein
LAVLAENEIAATAWIAVVAMTAMPSEANALADFEDGDVRRDGIENTRDFMAGHAWVGDSGEKAFFSEGVAVTDSASLHADANLSRAGFREFALNEFERAFSRGDLYGAAFDCGHGGFSCSGLDERAQVRDSEMTV